MALTGGQVDGNALYQQYVRNYNVSKGTQPGFGIASGSGLMSYADFLSYAKSQGIPVVDSIPRDAGFAAVLWLLVALL